MATKDGKEEGRKRLPRWTEAYDRACPMRNTDFLLEVGGGCMYDYDYEAGEFRVAGLPLLLQTPRDGDDEGDYTVGEDTGRRTWEAAVVIAKYLEHRPEEVAGKRVLELGAGTGATSLAALVCGAKEVCVTDLEYCLPTLRTNLASSTQTWETMLKKTTSDELIRNTAQKAIGASIRVAAIDWTVIANLYDTATATTTATTATIRAEARSKLVRYNFANVDAVVACEVVWLHELVEPLVKTLCALTSPEVGGNAAATIMMAYQSRSAELDDDLREALSAYNFEILVVPPGDLHPDFCFGRKIRILKVVRREVEKQNSTMPPTSIYK